MTAAEVHVLREIAPGAQIADDARIGHFCVIGPDAVIGPGTVLARRVTVIGHTRLGRGNVVGDGFVLGAAPQDLKFHGRPTYLIFGDRNRLGPNVTAHVGTEMGGYVTAVGSDTVLAAGVHVAHDCYVDDHVRLAEGVLLAGHIRVHAGAVIEDMVGVNHFTTIGRFARVAARTPVTRDVPPFSLFTSGGYHTRHASVAGVHEAGLAAAGLSDAAAAAVRAAIQYLFLDEREPLAAKVKELLARPGLDEPVRELAEFCGRRLAGLFGRYREVLRGKVPPEAAPFLPPDLAAELAAGLSAVLKSPISDLKSEISNLKSQIPNPEARP